VIVRYEPWGAWVKVEVPAALVALDRDGARAAGLDGGDAWSEGHTAPSAPVEVHLAVTGKCAAGCEGCYLDARPDGDEPPQETLLARLDALAAQGVFTVAFGGGEPITRDDLGELATAARARGLTPVLTTSGLGLSDARVARLGAFAQVNVSYDGAGEAYASVRGFDGAKAAEAAIERLARAGFAVGVNVVLTRHSFPHLRDTIRRARALGAREAQLLRYKPAGRAATLDYLARRLSTDQVDRFVATLRAISEEHASGDGEFHVRVDCALVPFLSADPSLEADTLARLGVFGCEAGDRLAAMRVDGKSAPCSFAPAADDAELARWRAYAAAPDEPCASCTLRPVCKGGCKVVSRFVDDRHGADPECPRVRAHRRASARASSS
jgi:radical SAM protein with 4Fe4S-binding SPASM domain